ncbi:MAG: hypothetical protein ACPG5Z_00210 [Pseudoalteromonas sp.]
MADLSKLSDAELQAMLGEDNEPSGLEGMSDEKLASMLQEPEEQGFLDSAIETAIDVGETIDSYTGAPTRAAIGALQEGENPFSAFGQQFGEDPSQAPTGKQIAMGAGLSSEKSLADISPNMPQFLNPTSLVDQKLKEEGFNIIEKPVKIIGEGDPLDISQAGAAGLAVDVAADPTLLVGGLVRKGLAGGASALKTTKAAQIAADVGMNTKGNVKEALRAAGRVMSPRRSKNYDRLLKIANRNKVDADILPHSVEFGTNSLPSRFQRFKAEGPLGEPVLNQMDEAVGQVENALESQIKTIGGEAPKGAEYGGAVIRDGFDEAVETLAKNTDVTYGNIHKLSPGIKLDTDSIESFQKTYNGINKWATGAIKRGVPGEGLSEAKHMKAVLNAVNATDGSVKQFVEVMQDVGKLAFNSKNYMEQTPKDIAQLRKLYFSMSDSVFGSVERQLGSTVAKDLARSNKLFKEFADNKFFVGQIGQKKVANETLFKSLIEKGDSNQIASLKKMLSPEKLQKLKGEYLGSLVSYDKNGEVLFTKLRKTLDKNNANLGLFTKKEIDSIRDISDLRASMGEKVLSHPGTGGSLQFLGFITDPVKSVLSNTVGDTLTARYIRKARGGGGSLTKQAKELNKLAKLSPKDAKGLTITLLNEKSKWLSTFSPTIARNISQQSNNKEPKGKNSWIINGIDNIVQTEPGKFNAKKIEKLFESNMGKKFLLSASDINIDSSAMKSHIKKIEKYLEGNK